MRFGAATSSTRRSRLLGASGSMLVMLLAGAARAEGAPKWLDWSAPPECPTVSDIEQRAVELFGGPLPRDRGLAVATELIWTGKDWEIAVELALDGHRGRRQVTVGRCTQAADFVAVAVVLAVDPASSQRLLDEHEEAEPTPAPVKPNAESAASVSDPPTTAVEGGPPSAAAMNRVRIVPHVSVLADGAVGVLPGVHLGGALWVGADIDRLALGVVAAWYPATSTTLEAARAPIDFGLTAGRANVAYWFLGPRVRVGPSLSVHVGVIESGQVDSRRAAVREPWLAVGAGPQAVVLLRGPVSLLVEGELNVPLLMPTFVLDDGTAVHRRSLGARIAVGTRISLGSDGLARAEH